MNKRKLNNPCVSSFDIFLLVCRSAVLEPTTVNFPSLCVSESRPVKIQSLKANICVTGVQTVTLSKLHWECILPSLELVLYHIEQTLWCDRLTFLWQLAF